MSEQIENRQQFIDELLENTKIPPENIIFRGKPLPLEVVEVPTEYLLFNIENNRTNFYALQYCYENNLGNHKEIFKIEDSHTKKLQDIQIGFMERELTGTKRDELINSYKAHKWNQTETFIIMRYGVVISGNRRLLLTKQKESDMPGVIKCRVIPKNYEKHWKEIEKKEEHTERGKQNHNWISKGLSISEDLDRGMSWEQITEDMGLEDTNNKNPNHKAMEFYHMYDLANKYLDSINQSYNWKALASGAAQAIKTQANKVMTDPDLEDYLVRNMQLIFTSKTDDLSQLKSIKKKSVHTMVEDLNKPENMKLVNEIFTTMFPKDNSGDGDNDFDDLLPNKKQEIDNDAFKRAIIGKENNQVDSKKTFQILENIDSRITIEKDNKKDLKKPEKLLEYLKSAKQALLAASNDEWLLVTNMIDVNDTLKNIEEKLTDIKTKIDNKKSQ